MAAERTFSGKLTYKKGDVGAIEVGNITSINGLGFEVGEIEVTDFSSTDEFREYIPSVKDGGEITVQGFIKDEETFGDLVELLDSREVDEWTVESPKGATWVFDGFLRSVREQAWEIESARGYELTLRVTGGVDYTEAPASV